MEEDSKLVLKMVGFEFDELKDVDGLIIPREVLLSDNKYDEVKKLIPELKKNLQLIIYDKSSKKC